MLRIVYVICICLVMLPAICQPAAKYEVATITDVRRHQPATDSGADSAKFDVSVQVADTIYTVLYTDPLGMDKVKYEAGRELLVHVGKNTITYNDMLGRPQEVPIIGQKPAKTTRPSK